MRRSVVTTRDEDLITRNCRVVCISYLTGPRKPQRRENQETDLDLIYFMLSLFAELRCLQSQACAVRDMKPF